MKKIQSDEPERFWNSRKDALRAQFEQHASIIDVPDFGTLWGHAGKNSTTGKTGSRLWKWTLPAAAAAVFLFFVFAPLGPSASRDVPQSLVVEQIFLSTSGGTGLGPAPNEVPNPGTFSALLKTIDKGFSHWDETSEE